MIRLHTGVPGTGKSLSMVDEIEHSSDYVDRPVYAHAVDGWERATPIACRNPACRGCRGLSDQERAGMLMVEEWADWAPAGALICIDEAHYAFPSRREREQPAYVQRLTEHRHDGVDFWLLTPNANMLDINVRRLVEEHVHHAKKGPLRYRIRHTECMENDDRLKLGDRTPWVLPKRSFGAYKSADAHVKLKGRVPRQVVMLGLLVPAAVGVAMYAVSAVGNLRYSVQEAEPGLEETATGVAELRPVAMSPVAAPAPVVPEVQTAVAQDRGLVVGCISLVAAGRCDCYNDQGFTVSIRPVSCRLVAAGQRDPRSLVVGYD